MDWIVTERLCRSRIDEQGLRISRSLSKIQHRFPFPTADELGKKFTSVTHTQQRHRRLLAGPLASRG
jgi:hypothetical protein